MRQKVEVITKPNIVKMVEVFYNLLKMICMVQSWITAFLVCKRPPQLDPKQHEVFADVPRIPRYGGKLRKLRTGIDCNLVYVPGTLVPKKWTTQLMVITCQNRTDFEKIFIDGKRSTL